jgi:CRP-like cAMP-binding protein
MSRLFAWRRSLVKGCVRAGPRDSAEPRQGSRERSLALRSNALLRRLGPAEVRVFLKNARDAYWATNDVVSQQGKPVDEVLFIVKGFAKAEISGAEDPSFRVVVKFLVAGDDIGLLSAIDGAPHPATVVALEDLYAVSVPLEVMKACLRENFHWYRHLTEVAVERLRVGGVWMQALL